MLGSDKSSKLAIEQEWEAVVRAGMLDETNHRYENPGTNF